MAPPPETPTPHRFLVPKRSGTQPRTETPKSLSSGSRQFQATPRFSLHSTPRTSAPSHPSSTPAAAAVGFARHRHADPINDAVESSPPFSEDTVGVSDSIENDIVPESSPAYGDDAETRGDDSRDYGDSPPLKRRRVSVSSASDMPIDSAYPEEEEMSFESDGEIQSGGEDAAITAHEPLSPSAVTHNKTTAQEPRFQKAPRFKPTENPEASAREPLPDAFSPHRRGAKYISGGLAAEVRDWLVDVEAGTGMKRGDELVAQVLVREVRRSRGMVLVEGSRVRDGHHQQQQGQDHRPDGAPTSAGQFRAILAGDGRLAGLDRRSEVQAGAIVGLARPIWEVVLDREGRWVVACDWMVCDDATT